MELTISIRRDGGRRDLWLRQLTEDFTEQVGFEDDLQLKKVWTEQGVKDGQARACPGGSTEGASESFIRAAMDGPCAKKNWK